MGYRTAKVTVDEFSRVVSEMYAASTNPENWMAALADIGQILDAKGCAVVMGGGTTRSVMASTVPPEARDNYVAYYHTMDYVLTPLRRARGSGTRRAGTGCFKDQFRIRCRLHAPVWDERRTFQTIDGGH